MTAYRLRIRPEADTELVEAARWYEEQMRGLGGNSFARFGPARMYFGVRHSCIRWLRARPDVFS